ncbi:MAG: hypothetical protein RMJ88_17100, partial [Thermogemmata sp.]|nr:hypothetical protein [Thermogemmata sp.]
MEGVQRLYRPAGEAERARWAEHFEPYVKDTAGHFVYRLKGRAATQAHLQAVGQALSVLLQAPAPTHADEVAFRVVQRLFTENFHVHERQARAKENHELSSGSLQSPDDPEAGYHTKGTAHSKG